ncbi:heme lyase CcmF/NrfE family subunit [Emcibacter sp.]|uniref:heme lyase CcmF/NrfE family subunit n=1 Tax=Emcibacter sp. TaxID=1979954 RepID=UPI002AA7CC89|nr:heme lyase CcmF/NrfE family subunit [Emcibacter sp.]
MIVETGHFALVLAFALAVVQGIVPLVGTYRRDDRLMALATPAAYGQFLLVLLSFLALMHAYVTSDFSVKNVAINSHTLKPMMYKIAGVWGNHEGSILFWALILALFGALVALFGRNLPKSLHVRVLSVQALVSVGFYLFLLLTSNPFDRIYPVPPEGNGLNPLLQDPGLAFHPPFLYLGYVGLSVAFSFSVAALLEGRVDPAWARWVRPWTLIAWCFLTIGIMLGSWWAYYELGWGGWWFWDPVENASFMPWLVTTALLHSAIVVEKRDTLKSWTVLLAIIAFSFSLLGTFLTRSGVVTSVHAFATDPERGVFILIFLLLVIGGSLLLYALRYDKLQPGGLFAPISREGALVMNNMLLTVGAATVLFGTLYPLILDALSGEKISVGPPYFEITFGSLMIPLVLIMAAGPFLRWKRADLAGVVHRMRFVLLAAIAMMIAGYFLANHDDNHRPLLTALWLGLGIWLMLGTLVELADRIKLFRAPLSDSLSRLGRQTRASWGMTLGHFGLSVLVLGITVTSSWQTEHLDVLVSGEKIEIGGYTLTFNGVKPLAGPNYTSLAGDFMVTDSNGAEVTRMVPESRTFTSPPMTTTEAAIHSTFLGDLFVAIGEGQGQNAAGLDRWSVRAYYKPLQLWLWSGVMIMVLGGLISLSDRRFRIGVPAGKKKTSGTKGGKAHAV